MVTATNLVVDQKTFRYYKSLSFKNTMIKAHIFIENLVKFLRKRQTYTSWNNTE